MPIKQCPKCGTVWGTTKKTCSWEKCNRARLMELTNYQDILHKEAEEARELMRRQEIPKSQW